MVDLMWFAENGFLTFGLAGAALGALVMPMKSTTELVIRLVVGALLSFLITPTISPMIAALIETSFGEAVAQPLKDRPAAVIGLIVGMIGYWVIAAIVIGGKNTMAAVKKDGVNYFHWIEWFWPTHRSVHPPPYVPPDPIEEETDNQPDQGTGVWPT